MVAEGGTPSKVPVAPVTWVVELRGFVKRAVGSLEKRVALFTRLSLTETLLTAVNFSYVIE